MNKISGTLLIGFGSFGLLMNYWLYKFLAIGILNTTADALWMESTWLYVLFGALLVAGVLLLRRKDPIEGS